MRHRVGSGEGLCTVRVHKRCAAGEVEVCNAVWMQSALYPLTDAGGKVEDERCESY